MSSLSDIAGKLIARTRWDRAPASGDEVSSFALSMRSRSRSFRRFIDFAPRPRSGVGSALALSFIVSGWFYGAVVAGTAPAVISGAAATVGLKATDIVLTGQVETTEQQIFDALAMGQNGSLLGFDAGQARQRLLDMPWVKAVAIRKLYPGKLKVAIAEKRAVAVWQHEDRLTVVQQSGAQIAKFGIADLINNRFSHLPHLVGKGAPETADEILPVVAQHPGIAGRVASYVRIANRRWDLELSNGLRIKLPEFGVAKKLEHLAALESEDRILEREIDVIDMRVADRVVLRLQPAAAKTRAELVTARLKAMKKADRKL